MLSNSAKGRIALSWIASLSEVRQLFLDRKLVKILKQILTYKPSFENEKKDCIFRWVLIVFETRKNNCLSTTLKGDGMADQKATNIKWHHGKITKEDRLKLMKQRGVTIWLTGLSGSGKSTIAVELEHALIENKHQAYILDGDNIRHGLNKNLGFSPEDRSENIRRIGEVAKLFTDANIITITAFISPYREDRDNARALQKDGEFIEVYVKCPLDVCEQRDTKGLYKKARAGEVKEFTGISAPYEEPSDPELTIDSSELSVEESTRAILNHLEEKGFVKF